MTNAFTKQATAFALLLLFLLPFMISTQAEDHLHGAPDLAITQFDLVPTRDGYQGTLKVTNIGLSSTETEGIMIMVFDEAGGSEANRSEVVLFPLLTLGPGAEFQKEFKWEPDVLGTHILWAVVDVDGVEEERTKENNVASLVIELPKLTSASSRMDGSHENNMFGNYISGIENWVDLELEYSDLEDPSLIRVYMTVNGQFLEYGSYDSGNTYTASFDAGSLPPGEHEMVVNSTYGGQFIGTDRFRINVIEQPSWFDNLEGPRSYFDDELSAYTLMGRLDVPGSSITSTMEGIGDIGPISIFQSADELFLTANILLDGTTTFTSECDIRVELGDTRTSIHQVDVTFSSEMDGPIDIDLTGSSDLELDLIDIAPGRQITVETPIDRIDLPLPSLPLTGNLDALTTFKIMEDGSIGRFSWNVSWDLIGNTTDLLSVHLPGYDDPMVGLSLEMDWNTFFVNDEGRVSEDSEMLLDTDIYVNDLGLEWGTRPDDWDLITKGTGLDIASDINGRIGTLSLSVKEGHMTHLVYKDDTIESEIYVNNTYKSSPDLEYLWDGRPIVVWTETGYMEDRWDRADSMRMKYMIGDAGGNFSGEPIPLFSDGHMDQHPVLASDPGNERCALIWIRDMDGNASTLNDREVMIAYYEVTGWTSPVRLTIDNHTDHQPDVHLGSDGRTYTMWFSDGDPVYYSWRSGSPIEVPKDIDIPGDVKIHHMEFIKIGGKAPSIKLITSSPGEGYQFLILENYQNQKQVSVVSSNGYLRDPGAFSGPYGSNIVYWNNWEDRGGDIFCSITTGEAFEGPWSSPLQVTSDLDIEDSTVISWIGDEFFTLGTLIHQNIEDGDITSSPDLFRSIDLSWGGEIISVDLTPGPGTTPGSMVKVTSSVEYRGLHPDGMVWVDIYRVFRDKDTGDTTQEFWDSELVEFTVLGQIQLVEFTLPVKEYQLGILVYTRAALSNIPAHHSQRFESLPAIPDLEVLSLKIARIEPDQATARIEVVIKNWGVVPSGTQIIRLFSSQPSAPLLFENRSFEPLFLREREIWMELNSTEVDVPAGGTISQEMNISLSPGLNHMWARLDGPDWLPSPQSSEELVIMSLPLLKMDVKWPDIFLDRDDDINISVYIENLGPWSMNTSYLLPPRAAGYDLHNGIPNYTISTNLWFSRVGSLISNTTVIPDLSPGNGEWFNWTIPSLGASGMLIVNISISPGVGYDINGWKDIFSSSTILLSSEPDLSFLSLVQSKAGDVYTNSIDVQFMNPTGTRMDVVHIKIFNGLPEDDVVISEALVLDLGPGEFGNYTLNMPLDEGRYFITATAEAGTVSDNGQSVDWVYLDRYVRDISVEEARSPVGTVEEEVNMDEFTTAAIVSLSSIMLVLMISSFFFRKEPEEDEDK